MSDGDERIYGPEKQKDIQEVQFLEKASVQDGAPDPVYVYILYFFQNVNFKTLKKANFPQFYSHF